MRILLGIFLLVHAMSTCIRGYPGPDVREFFQRSSWVDKLPSVEVKFETDGIKVSTGPSREEIYWMLGYIVGGLVLTVLSCLAIVFCIYKCFSRNNPVPQIIAVREVPFGHANSNNAGFTTGTNLNTLHIQQPTPSSRNFQASEFNGYYLTDSRGQFIQNEGSYRDTRNPDLKSPQPPPPYRSRN